MRPSAWHTDLGLPGLTLNSEIEVLVLKLSTSRIMEQGQKLSRDIYGTPQVMIPPQMMYYGGYPVNQDQVQSPYFGYDHNPFNSSPNFSPNQDTEQSSISTFPASNSQPELGVKSEEPTDFPVNPPLIIGENNRRNNQNIVNSSPSSSCKPELLVSSVDNALKGTGSSKTDNTVLPKIGKVSHSAHRTKLPQQTLTSSRSTQKVHSKARPKKPHQEVSTESSSKNLQQPNPFDHWYQMMSQYYNQFYSPYQMAQLPVLPQQSTSHLSMNKSSKTPASHPLNPTIKNGPEGFQIPSVNQIGSFDYANYYYQYYAAAAQLWSGGYPYQFFGTCIPETPRFYNTPHIKAWISCPGVIVQVLPSRPRNGEFARVEIINLFELVNEAVADATRRASDNTTRTCDSEFSQQQQQPSEQNALFNMTDSGMQTPSRLSSIDAGGAEDDGEEIRACVMATACWNQAEHQFYPGPLNRIGTLKADVLAFLHEKLTEIQDRLPIDWGSAGLLIMFLETLIKNNGNLQTSDLVNLLLEGHKPTTDSFRSGSYRYSSSSYLGVQVPVQYSGTLNNYNHQVGDYANESLASLPGSQVTSGRESPESHFEIDYGSNLLQHSKAASETGRMNSVQNIIRRMGGVHIGERGSRSQESEGKLLDRFRELLMHGLPIKALEHACRSKLWGHAFTLAHRMGPSTFAKVMDRFLNNDISISDPILTLYQLTAGEMPQSVNTAAYGRGIDNGDWRPHLAMILAGHSSQSDLSLLALERLGDGLLSRKHVYAAHLCYLLMNSLKNIDDKQKEFRLPGKIWLIGVPPTYITSGGDVVNNTSDGFQEDNIASNHTLSPLFATSEAIQLTEIYEYSIQLANRKFHLRQLMPFRLVYAIRLLDAGFIEKAYRYLTAIGNEILTELDETAHQLKLQSVYNDNNNNNNNTYVDPLLYSLISNCLRLAEPLQYHPEIESFDILQLSTNNQIMEDYSFGFQFKNPSYSMPVQNKNKNWIERLNQIFNQMNQKINHPRYKTSVEKPKENPSSDAHFTNEAMKTEYSDHNDSNDPHPPPPPHHHHQSSLPPQQQQQQQQRQYHQFNKESNYKPSVEYRSNVQTHDSSLFLSTDNRDQRKVNIFNSNRNDNNYIPHEVNNNNNNNNNNNKEPKIISNYSSIRNNKNDQLVDPIQKMNSSNQSSIHQRQLFNHESFSPQSPPSLSSVPSHEYSYQSESYRQLSSNSTSNLIQQHNYSMNSPVQLSNYPLSSQSDQPINSMLQSTLAVSTSSSSLSVTTTLNEMNNSIFMPINHQTDSQLMINNDNSSLNYSTLSNQQPFDYFANIQSIQSRSRTVSGNSENNTVNMINSTTVDQLDSSSNNSRNFLSTKYDNSFTNEQHFQQPQKQSISNLSQMNYLPQPSRHPSSMMNDHFKDYNNTLATTTTATTSTTTINNDNNSSSERFTQDKSSDLNNLDKNEQQSKDGWLSGWFGRLKKNGPKNVHLPDDSKPSIVWDDRLKQWIDVNDPDGSESNKVPPPPPASSFIMPKNDDSSMSNSSSNNNINNNSSALNPPLFPTYHPVSVPSGSISSRTSNSRSRYVNILASDTLESGANKLINPLQPPLPQTINNLRS